MHPRFGCGLQVENGGISWLFGLFCRRRSWKCRVGSCLFAEGIIGRMTRSNRGCCRSSASRAAAEPHAAVQAAIRPCLLAASHPEVVANGIFHFRRLEAPLQCHSLLQTAILGSQRSMGRTNASPGGVHNLGFFLFSSRWVLAPRFALSVPAKFVGPNYWPDQRSATAQDPQSFFLGGLTT